MMDGGYDALKSYLERCEELGVAPLRDLEDSLSLAQSRKTRNLHIGYDCGLESSLKELVLEDIRMPDDAWLALTSAVDSSGLVYLSVMSSPLGDVDPSLLAAALGRLTTLKSLRLTNNDLGHEFVSALVKTPVISNSSMLEGLYLSNNNIGNTGAIAIAHALVTKDLGLRIVDLSYNNVGNDGAQALGYAMAGERTKKGKKMIKLEVLELEGNQIGDMGGVALGAALFKASTLGRINLGANDLGHTAIHAIADSLRSGAHGLRELALDENQSNEAALVHLLQSVADHGMLLLLDIKGCPLKSAACKALADLLQVHCSLKVLKVTVASHAQGAEIARALSKNSSLTELTIHGPVDNATRAAIEAVLERNRGVGPQQVMSAKQNPHPAESNEAAQQFDGMKSLQLAYPYKKPPATASNRPASAPLKPTLNVRDKTVLSPRTPNIGRRGTHHGTNQPENKRIMSSVVGGGAQAMAGEIFRKCDRNKSNFLERDEFRLALRMAGALDGVKASEEASYSDFLFKKSDTKGEGRVTLDKWGELFSVEMAKRGINNRRQKIDIPDSFESAVPKGYASNHQLKEIFDGFCAFGYGHGLTRQSRLDKMNAFQFSKFCRDAGFMQPKGGLSPNSVDVIFTKANKYNMNNRNLSYKAFLEALALVAFELDCKFEDVAAMLGVEAVQDRREESDASDVRGWETDNLSPRTQGPRRSKTPSKRSKSTTEKIKSQNDSWTIYSPDTYESRKPSKTGGSRPQDPAIPKHEWSHASVAKLAHQPTGFDAGALADMLTHRLRAELDIFKARLEGRLSSIEERVAAVEAS